MCLRPSEDQGIQTAPPGVIQKVTFAAPPKDSFLLPH